jgi:hypothetical protein
MIKKLIKAAFLGWIAKKFLNRSSGRTPRRYPR